MKLLLQSRSVARALQVATDAHRGQVDKAGEDYIKHPMAVAEALDTEEAQTAALLHDVVEDTPLTFEDLRREGFSAEIIDAVRHLTRGTDEPRDAYLRRVAEDPLAIRVKLADLAHNSDLRRLKSPSDGDLARAERYARERAFLEEKLKKIGGGK